MFRSFMVLLFLLVLTGCSAVDSMESKTAANDCPVTEPAWVKPPDDTAVDGSPAYGHYFVNADQSIMASAGWVFDQEYLLAERENGIKMGWFRPAGATLEITGQRLDGDSPPLEAIIPCCYPTRFQASGLIFPTEGCWEITAKAADRELSFVVSVTPD
jgi:hypothetical protein